jgi:demethylmenaquinone methyltransferase/2-methoxy-6-polyprenyl-1,4-benzoquinol methylase
VRLRVVRSAVDGARVYARGAGVAAPPVVSDERTYYARRAPEYEAIYARPERQADLAEVRARLVERLADRHVLEVACGTGYWTQAVAPVARSLVGVDASSEVLELARAKPGCALATFVRGDAWAPPVGDPPFDAALAAFWWSHVATRRAVEFLRALDARLAPGATVVLVDNRYVPGSSTPIAHTDADGDTFQDRPLADGSVHRVRKNFPTADGFGEVLRAALPGASACEWWTSTYFWMASWRSG